MNQPKKNQGGALLTALFIMTLVAIVATAMSLRLSSDIYRTSLMINHDQLYLASQALQFWGLTELNNPKNKFDSANSAGMVKEYPKKLKAVFTGVELKGGLYDLQTRVNLNNVKDKASSALLANLLGNISYKINDNDRNNLIGTVKNWLTPYNLDQGHDSYVEYYLNQAPPYYPSHQTFKSSSEFRLLKGVNANLDLAIQPFITALPDNNAAININTAPKLVLMSLGHGLTAKEAEELINIREEKGVNRNQDINKFLRKMNLPNQQITLESQYFLGIAQVKNSELEMVVYTLFKRNRNKNGKWLANIVRESINTL